MAASGRAGIDSGRAADVDVIITNLGLPDMHGLDLGGHLAEIVNPRQCMIVALTVRDGSALRDEVRQAGVCSEQVLRRDDASALVPDVFLENWNS